MFQSTESYMFVPYYNKEEIIDDFDKRLWPLVDVASQLPEISFELLQKQVWIVLQIYMVYPIQDQYGLLYHSSIVSAVQTTLVSCLVLFYDVYITLFQDLDEN